MCMTDRELKNLRDKFLNIARTYIHRDGIDALLSWLEETDFYSAPASTRYHDSEPGGLVAHSVQVYEHLVFLDKAYQTKFNPESIAITALFHDLCKVDCYEVSTRNVKDPETGTWHTEPFYKWKEKNIYGGHGSKSVFIVQSFMKLYFPEASAIQCHMGFNDTGDPVYDVYRTNALAFLLHTADMASTSDDMNRIISALNRED